MPPHPADPAALDSAVDHDFRPVLLEQAKGFFWETQIRVSPSSCDNGVTVGHEPSGDGLAEKTGSASDQNLCLRHCCGGF